MTYADARRWGSASARSGAATATTIRPTLIRPGSSNLTIGARPDWHWTAGIDPKRTPPYGAESSSQSEPRDLRIVLQNVNRSPSACADVVPRFSESRRSACSASRDTATARRRRSRLRDIAAMDRRISHAPWARRPKPVRALRAASAAASLVVTSARCPQSRPRGSWRIYCQRPPQVDAVWRRMS